MEDKSPSEQIDDIIKTYGGWKGEALSKLRNVILQVGPEITEEIKWKMATRPEGLPVWSHNGIVCFAETWKDNIKLLFPKGAQLADTQNLFNARLKSAEVRAIEIREDGSINEPALMDLVREAVEVNMAKTSKG